uniref:Uncharacterized protein n=1 Tax=Romanomermis culicivorax TaxID=13658 RepID=A0A915J9W6_ROMCU
MQITLHSEKCFTNESSKVEGQAIIVYDCSTFSETTEYDKGYLIKNCYHLEKIVTFEQDMGGTSKGENLQNQPIKTLLHLQCLYIEEPFKVDSKV